MKARKLLADYQDSISSFDACLSLRNGTALALVEGWYALILVAGIALLILAKKRKPSKDEEYRQKKNTMTLKREGSFGSSFLLKCDRIQYT